MIFVTLEAETSNAHLKCMVAWIGMNSGKCNSPFGRKTPEISEGEDGKLDQT